MHSAILRHLEKEGIDTFQLSMQIEELIIKTMLSVESRMAHASHLFLQHNRTCFELYGFDILIDEQLKPWLLEVNLSPSFECASILDLKLKSNMLIDLLNLAGLCCTPADSSQKSKMSFDSLRLNVDGRNQSTATKWSYHDAMQTMCLYKNETQLFNSIENEAQHCGHWVRVFPTADTWTFFSEFLEHRPTSYNLILHQLLFPRRWSCGSQPLRLSNQSRSELLASAHRKMLNNAPDISTSQTSDVDLTEAIKRYQLYYRKFDDTANIIDFDLLQKIQSEFQAIASDRRKMLQERKQLPMTIS
jgi:hypothetical protein